jgi:hypothetical protein
MRKRLHSQEALEFDDRGTVAQSQPNLSSRFEVKQEHRDTGEGKTREGIKDLLRISGVRDVGEQRGKNHQRNLKIQGSYYSLVNPPDNQSDL